MANKFCSKCGKEVVAGKRFCGGCGQAMPVASEAVCGQCGAALLPGKKFCKQCGHAVGEAAVAAEAIQVPEPVPVAQTVVTPNLPEVAAHAATVILPVEEPVMASGAEFTAERDPASQWDFVHPTAQPPRFSSQTLYEPEHRAEREFVPDHPSKTKLWLAIGVAAAVLLAAGGGWALYAHNHRAASHEVGQVAVTPPPPVAVTPDESTKPPAGTTAGTGTSVVPPPINPPRRVEPDKPREIATEKKPDSHPPMVIPPPVVTPPQIAQGRSGVRHYNGPPVAHGGTVVFDNLPKARLKFTFDHTAWQLTIKPNPDGTKKVTLSSLAQGYQTSCDLGWEIVE